MATHSTKRRAANPGALTKSITYANGIFSATTDIRALVEAFGAERVTIIAQAMERELNTIKSRARSNKARKVAAHQDKVIKSQISEHVSRTISQYKSTRTINAKKAA